jgi:hypothetical protein
MLYLPIAKIARIIRRSPRSPRLVAIHEPWCPTRAEQPHECRCDAVWFLVSARAARGGRR